MAEIERVETIILDVPMSRHHYMPTAAIGAKLAVTLVKITCSDGVVGLGEATTIGKLTYTPECAESVKAVIDAYIAPLLLHQRSDHYGPLLDRLHGSIEGNRFAKCAIETALLDAHAQRIGVSFSDLLGGRRRSSVPVLWTLASGDYACDVDEAQALIEARRHNTFKIKLGLQEFSKDLAYIANLRKTLGPKVRLRADVNQAWSRSQAMQAAIQLSELDIELLEQPISKFDFDGMAQLAAHSPIPIMADEMLDGPRGAMNVVRYQSADILAVKIAQSGGPLVAKDVIAIARAANLDVYGGTMLESGIGSIASAHLFSTLPEIPFGTELFGPLLQEESLLADPLRYENFELHLPDKAGLGVALDEDKIAFYRRDKQS